MWEERKEEREGESQTGSCLHISQSLSLPGSPSVPLSLLLHLNHNPSRSVACLSPSGQLGAEGPEGAELQLGCPSSSPKVCPPVHLPIFFFFF